MTTREDVDAARDLAEEKLSVLSSELSAESHTYAEHRKLETLVAQKEHEQFLKTAGFHNRVDEQSPSQPPPHAEPSTQRSQQDLDHEAQLTSNMARLKVSGFLPLPILTTTTQDDC